MDSDTALVIGLVLAVLAIPAMVSAFSDRRTPRIASVVTIIAGGLMVWAINEKAGAGNPYRLQDLPNVIYRVIGNLMG